MMATRCIIAGLLVALFVPCAWGQCDCPGQFDPTRNGIPLEVGDLVLTVNRAFFGVDAVTTPTCVCQDGDVDCNGVIDILDLVALLRVIAGDTDLGQLCAPDVSCSIAHCAGATDHASGGDVFIESKTVPLGAVGVQVGVYIFNSVDLSAVVLPLEFRSNTPGSFVADSLRIAVQGRVAASWSGGSAVTTQACYAAPYTANACSGPTANSYHTPVSELPLPLTSPFGILWSGFVDRAQCLPSGLDGFPGNGTPSLVLTFDVTSTPGVFEIDTCCIAPGSHLAFVDCSADTMLVPRFTKGVLTIGGGPAPCACACVADPRCDGTTDIIDVIAVINTAFRGGGATFDPGCANSREDVDCNGHVDVADVGRVISVAIRGADPGTMYCSPCRQ